MGAIRVGSEAARQPPRSTVFRQAHPTGLGEGVVSILAEYAEGIRGVVWDADADAPASGASVRLEVDGQALAETRTDPDGVFAFEAAGQLQIAPGVYRLVVDIGGRRAARSVTVDASEPVTLVGRVEV